MKVRYFLFASVALAAPALAEPVQFSAVVREEAGYGTNPFLRPGVTDGAAFLSLSVSPRLTRRTALSTTTLAGDYSRDQYLNSFGYTDSLQASLTRIDQLSQHLSSTLSASYSTSNRAIFYGPTEFVSQDPLSIGQRTRHEDLTYQLQWQATSADQISYGANVSHLSYGGARATLNGTASGYTQYGVNGAYYHAFDARTSAGAQVNVTTVSSRVYPNSRSIEPSLTAKRQLTAVWNIEGHVGLVLQRTYGPFGDSSTSIGFGTTLCGVYPQTHFCISASRASQPSGFGGLRTNSELTASLSHTIDEHSRVNFHGSFTKSDAIGSSLLRASSIRTSRAILASGDYDHDVTQRISAGFGGRYQWRDTSGIGIARLVAATVHVAMKFGRI